MSNPGTNFTTTFRNGRSPFVLTTLRLVHGQQHRIGTHTRPLATCTSVHSPTGLARCSIAPPSGLPAAFVMPSARICRLRPYRRPRLSPDSQDMGCKDMSWKRWLGLTPDAPPGPCADPACPTAEPRSVALRSCTPADPGRSRHDVESRQQRGRTQRRRRCRKSTAYRSTTARRTRCNSITSDGTIRWR
jgi:hypothetical protein